MLTELHGKENVKFYANSPKTASPSKFSPSVKRSPSKLQNGASAKPIFKLENPTPKKSFTPNKNKTNSHLLANKNSPSMILKERAQRERTPNNAVALSPLAWSPTNRRSPYTKSSTHSPIAWSPSTLKLNSPSVVSHAHAPLNFDSELVYDEYGFQTDENEKIPPTPTRGVDKLFWEKTLAEWEFPLNPKAANTLVLRGIHPELRAAVWKKLMSVEEVKEFHNNEGIFYHYLRKCGQNAHTSQIKLDLNRTFPTHKLFQQKKGLDILYNILCAYSHFNQMVGYCQGMAYIVGVLMMFMEEEDAFWTFVCMMKRIEKYFGDSMEGVLTDTNLLTSCIKIQMPLLFSHLQENKMDTILFSSKWLLSMFTDMCNWESVLRFWDIFFYQGRQGLIRICLGILANSEGELLAKKGMENIMPFVVNPPAHSVSPDTVFKKILLIDVNELFEKIKTANTPQPSRVVSFFNQMVTSIDYMMTPRTEEKTQRRVYQQTFETPTGRTPMRTPRSVREHSSQMPVLLQNVTAFNEFSTPKYIRERSVVLDVEELTPRKRALLGYQQQEETNYPVKKLRF